MCLWGSSSASVQVASRPMDTGSASKSRDWKSVGLPPCLVKTLTVTGIGFSSGGRAAPQVAAAPAALDPAPVHHGAVLLCRRQRLAKKQAAPEHLGFLGHPRSGRFGQA